MKTWQAISWRGDTFIISSYTRSEAFQKAEEYCRDTGGLKSFEEM